MICLAGHIDHGKSALVQALTGGVVDRLPEEKRRGITIELGFSHFDSGGRRFALIDVPGHERLIHTMVAGASGVDAALLVIAADDSVMPQTREHLAVLELMGVRRGVIAITKCDLADGEQLELVDWEVAELTAPTFLASAPRVRVSGVSGLGIAELRQALIDAARLAPVRAAGDQRFRLPIDRAFSAAGQGAVVTGTVWRGTAIVADTLHLLPQAVPVRVRRVQSQGIDVERAAAGERAAINLAGVKASDIRRGDELATPGAYEPSRRHLVQMRLLPSAVQCLRHRQSVRLHLGATQVTAQVLMAQRQVSPGESAFAILKCESPIVAEYGQPFVLRQLSPPETVGGGTIVLPGLRPVDRLTRCLAAAEGLADADLQVRLAAYIDLRRETSFDEGTESRLGVSKSQWECAVEELARRREVIRTSGPQQRIVGAERLAQLKRQIVQSCQAELERRRPASQLPLAVLLSALKRQASLGVLEYVTEMMTAQGELVRRGDRVGLPSGAELSHRQRRMLDTLIAECTSGGRTPPTLKELAARHGFVLRDLEPLVQIAVDDGRLVRLSAELAMDRDALETLRQSLADYFKDHATAKIGDLREQWGITRKHAVPLFEFFDQRKITARVGDAHSAGPQLLHSFDEAAP